MKTTLHARLAVELARDTYLHAALDGVLASPKIQSKMEMDLHKSLTLLNEAYAAEQRGNNKATQKLIKQILDITKKIKVEKKPGTKVIQTTLHAQMAVELARDTYLHAALDGVLASPRIQNKLEKNLGKAHSLLSEAYKAEERGDMKTVRELIHQVLKITDKIITESQEPKK